jgi:hypothetical protein
MQIQIWIQEPIECRSNVDPDPKHWLDLYWNQNGDPPTLYAWKRMRPWRQDRTCSTISITTDWPRTPNLSACLGWPTNTRCVVTCTYRPGFWSTIIIIPVCGSWWGYLYKCRSRFKSSHIWNQIRIHIIFLGTDPRIQIDAFSNLGTLIFF